MKAGKLGLSPMNIMQHSIPFNVDIVVHANSMLVSAGS